MEDSILAELLDAMGGESRIASVKTFACDAVLRRTVLHGPVQSPGAFLRELTFRAAGGRVRVERFADDESGAEALVSLAIAGPDVRHEHEGSGGDATAAAECVACAGAQVLVEARRAPRNLLAHAAELEARARVGPDGAWEVVPASDDLVYRFDPGSRLCVERVDPRADRTTSYRDWRRVGGVSTPFLEIERDPRGTRERRLLAAAYDLPLPDRLFWHPPPRTL